MTLRICVVMLAIAFVPVANTNPTGQEPLTPEAPWIGAKKTYLETHETLRQTVINHLDALESKARERGDLAKLKEVKAERLGNGARVSRKPRVEGGERDV